ncbi:phage tail assembly chaperone [Maridesulfovibrio bastinii]|uniref:phage tail assembly chaperone n=1 Tax=Maridesulfovibrio bastinii TaxID=47157 RepID=UPI0006873D28|nr:phage tail assembly chaperone [Maridesulfovibrio bastinii]
MRVFIYMGSVINVDNEADAERLESMGGVALTDDEADTLFGHDIALAGPQNTTVDASGHIVYTPAPGPTFDQQTSAIRSERDSRIKAVEWRIERYRSEIRQGLTPTDDITKLDTYVQALRDITTDENFPWDGDISKVSWPEIQE